MGQVAHAQQKHGGNYAGSVVVDAGLANSGDGRWANVNPLSYQSTVDADIHVIGDSQATAQPKSGHIANAEAKVCADAIIVHGELWSNFERHA